MSTSPEDRLVNVQREIDRHAATLDQGLLRASADAVIHSSFSEFEIQEFVDLTRRISIMLDEQRLWHQYAGSLLSRSRQRRRGR